MNRYSNSYFLIQDVVELLGLFLFLSAVTDHVVLDDIESVVDGRAEVGVRPASAAEQVAKELHNCTLGGSIISVRKVCTLYYLTFSMQF